MNILLRKAFTLLILILPFFACKRNTGSIRLSSPDTTYTFHLDVQDSLCYRVDWKGQSIIEKSALGFKLSDGTVFPHAVEAGHIEKLSKNVNWQPVYGERNAYTDKYNEVLVQLTGKTFEGGLAFRVRAYNEGIAFRYEITSEKELQV
ncbi:MAG: glycoside hydrolase family 97 N-terminal domain-containing protein, partial [Bacteroidota bacterium]|nr:glycoside hydrolase family 97 N-terminal domain-containing protein [Bacteroidota bacterium]